MASFRLTIEAITSKLSSALYDERKVLVHPEVLHPRDCLRASVPFLAQGFSFRWRLVYVACTLSFRGGFRHPIFLAPNLEIQFRPNTAASFRSLTAAATLI